jgi:hypothetical protein
VKQEQQLRFEVWLAAGQEEKRTTKQNQGPCRAFSSYFVEEDERRV